MDADGLAGTAQVGEVFVDEKRPMMIVERAFAADEELHLLDPGGMVDQIFEGGPGLVDLLQVEAIVGPVLVAVYVAGPAADFEGKNGFDPVVARGHFRFRQRVFQQQIAPQVEKKNFDFGRFGEVGIHRCTC